jgi:hypothetical protein
LYIATRKILQPFYLPGLFAVWPGGKNIWKTIFQLKSALSVLKTANLVQENTCFADNGLV